ncbi:unnamed protein product [Didymodactylos carnosus]|uniref:Uncharacterized protein n=1 Tax=Didymodactylos carnosus TaxID=1234261 RepID=A0A8S2D6M0_9BILA|nr:unnamed protein product [Didymodactylos carnosus]CAF3635648.1 unnamed protein product [Didymodactylos carnosus]CAF3684056.1 unnamed protein product [Didymodactylos carnosus]
MTTDDSNKGSPVTVGFICCGDCTEILCPEACVKAIAIRSTLDGPGIVILMTTAATVIVSLISCVPAGK